MRPISPTDVARTRVIAVWMIRAVSLSSTGLGLYLVLKKLLFALVAPTGEGLWFMFRVWDDVGEQQSTFRGLAMIILGVALGLASSRLARWVVALPASGCPRCGYDAAGRDRCPECGLELGARSEPRDDGPRPVA